MRHCAAVTFLSPSGGDAMASVLSLLVLVAPQVFGTWGDQTRRNVYRTLCFLPAICSFDFCFYLGFLRGVKFFCSLHLPGCSRCDSFLTCLNLASFSQIYQKLL